MKSFLARLTSWRKAAIGGMATSSTSIQALHKNHQEQMKDLINP